MKVSTTLFTFYFALNAALSPALAVEEVDDAAPCGGDPEDDEEPECLDQGLVCTMTPESCCDGLACTGFGFYKKCEEPPVCLEKWHDCSDGTPCCDGTVCVKGDNGQLECQVPAIGKRTVVIGQHGSLVDNTTPTPAPAPKNLKTTKIEGEPIVKNVACSSGDPHIRTFDRLTYDCQGEGEHILLKSKTTQRQVNARYVHLSKNKAISVGKGVAVQDEGDTPLVQVNVAERDDSLGTKMSDGYILQLFVDGEQRELLEGSGDERVSVTVDNGNVIKIRYEVSEFEVTAKYFRGRFNICAHLPDTDDTVGILGTANKNVADDWTTLTGEVIELPASRAGKMRKPGYDFCTKYFCERDEAKSMFVHLEAGYDFEYYEQCDLPYGETVEKYLLHTPKWVLELCGNDAACIMDTMNGDAEDARELRNAKLMTSRFCSTSGSDCDNDDSCCGDSKCVDLGGVAGKECDGDATCAPEFGSCEKVGCCGELTCTQLNDGTSQCLDERECQDEWMSCGNGKECCDGTVCLKNFIKGTQECRKLPTCARKKDDCSLVSCCGSLKCMDHPSGGKQCQDVPGCWPRQNKDCSDTPCCDGLTCVKDGEKQLCKRLPTCMKRVGQSCEYVPCCENEKNPRECVEVTDKLGNKGKQCRLVPGDAEISVWNDLNANGIKDENEPGLEGVEVKLWNHKTKEFTKHESVESNSDGMVKFIGVPKGQPIRAVVTKAPLGAIHTRVGRGKDKSVDSDLLKDGRSRTFRLKGITETWTNTSLGFVMPQETEVKVFNDLNGNGIQEEGEMGIKGVGLRLVQYNNKNKAYTNLGEQNNGGNAHTLLKTDADGMVTFTGVPQFIKLQVDVVGAPDGAAPTKMNAGENDAIDSDLQRNGKSVSFVVKGSEGVSNLALGYRMPETVNVRVWDDTNSNGIQDEGEDGIPGIKVRLVNSDKEKTDFVSDVGTSGKVLTTDEDGSVSFSKVPQRKNLHVKVLTPPKGAVATRRNKGENDELDSDLQNNGLSERFQLTESGATFSEIDLGYRMPNSMIVRVWDDSNGNGVQDEGEDGIPNVQLRLVNNDKEKTPLVTTSGTAGKKVKTNAQGFASFTQVPQGKKLRVQVLNAPKGATVTLRNKGGDEEQDSDLQSSGLSDPFTIQEAGDYTQVDLGYRMPVQMTVRVWDDQNNNGLQDEGEEGIEGVKLRLIKDKGKANLEKVASGNAHQVLVTGTDGTVTFTGIPKGVHLRVKVVNKPKGAVSAKSNANRNKADDRDSDLEGKGAWSSRFNLGTFEGDIFDKIDLGFLMPADLQVRLWDDINSNGIQDEGELGIPGVKLFIVNNDKNMTRIGKTSGTAHQMLTTDENGLVTFTTVPKGKKFRVKIKNKPVGATVTKRNAGRNKQEDTDSDLDARKMASDLFNMASFHDDGICGNIDLGLKLPADMQVRVWDDVNGNGIQDEDEPGLKGVKLQLVDNNKKRTPLDNQGRGSTAHHVLKTDENGLVVFEKVPKGRNLRVKVLNAPEGSVHTKKNANRNKNDEGDSELNKDMTSDPFNLGKLTEDKVYGSLDLGFKMPKKVIVRVWNDVDEDGLQGDEEEGVGGVQVRLVLSKADKTTGEYKDIPGFTATKTDKNGRATFDKVPQGIHMRVEITYPEGATQTKKNANRNKMDQLDSDINANGLTDGFRLPSNANPLFDKMDAGLVFAEAA